MDVPTDLTPTLGVETALRVLGGKWKVLIVWHLIDRPQHYGALRRLMPMISEKMLIRQLRELERDGLVRRTIKPLVPPRVEYAITAYGQSVFPILGALCQWGWSHLEREPPAPGAVER
jgi:DNA-binding HxlR family transcriptional regulator